MDLFVERIQLCVCTAKIVFTLFFLQVCSAQPTYVISYQLALSFNSIYFVMNIIAFKINNDILIKFSHGVSLVAAMCVVTSVAYPNYQQFGWLLFSYLGCYICEVIVCIFYAIYRNHFRKCLMRSGEPPPYCAPDPLPAYSPATEEVQLNMLTSPNPGPVEPTV
jgi:hypothetical protein